MQQLCLGENRQVINENLQRDNKTGIWYSYDTNVNLAWQDAVNYCKNLGLSLIIINSLDKLILASNLTSAANKKSWVK